MVAPAVVDAHIAAAIKTIEELEALITMLGTFVDDPELVSKRASVASKLREIANLLDKLPLLSNDLSVIKRRLRGMLSMDPDKTPRPISLREFAAITEETRVEPVEDRERRAPTRPGLGVPMPKKTPPA